MKKKSNGLTTVLLIVEVLVFLFLSSLLIIGKIWEPAEKDTYVYPTAQVVETANLQIGEEKQLTLPEMKANETMGRILVSNTDVLAVDEQLNATALAQFHDAKVWVYIVEKEIPEELPAYQDVKFFGLDLTDFLNNLHDQVRDFLNIEKIEPPRTEIRDLEIYEYDFVIDGFSENASSTASAGTFTLGKTHSVALTAPEGQVIVSVVSSDESVATVTYSGGQYTVNPLKEGSFDIIVTYGKVIQVDEVTSQEFNAWVKGSE